MILLLFALAIGPAVATDGNTLVTADGERVRLAGVDCPTLAERGGRAAKAKLAELLEGGDVSCQKVGDDRRTGRTVAVCYVEFNDVGRELVRSGVCVADGARYRVLDVDGNDDDQSLPSR